MTSDETRQAIYGRVAHILQEERLKRRLSLSAVAEGAGISYQMVSYVEREMRNPTLDTLLPITGVFGIRLAEVIRKAETGSAGED